MSSKVIARSEKLMSWSYVTDEALADSALNILEYMRGELKEEAIYRVRRRYRIKPERPVTATIYREVLEPTQEARDEKRLTAWIRLDWIRGGKP